MSVLQYLTGNIHFTQEQLKEMSELHAPEFVERDGVLYYCPYNNMFNIWHNIGGNPNYPEWNYVKAHSLEYTVYSGNRKPTKEEIVSCDNLFKYLRENNYYCKVCFKTDDGLMYVYRPDIPSGDYGYRPLILW